MVMTELHPHHLFRGRLAHARLQGGDEDGEDEADA